MWKQKGTLTTGSASACALSRKWKRDRLSRRWRRCRSTPSSTISSPSLGRLRVDPAPTSAPISGNSPSPSLIDADTGNHVTSGYESETSPTSTTTNPRVEDDDPERRGSSTAGLDQPGGLDPTGPGSPRSDQQRRRRTSPDSGHADDLGVCSLGGPESPRSVCYR